MPALIFCVEPGKLFSQAELLAKSIKQYAGNFFSDVLAFSPREDHQLDTKSKKTLAALNVEVISIPLNFNHLDYPIANKILACAWAEQHLNTETIIMVDTDTIFLAPPVELTDQPNEIQVRPVDRPGQASLGPETTYESFWKKAYELCDTPFDDSYIKTGVNQVTIRPYFNAGLVSYKRRTKLGSMWLSHLDKLRAYGHHPGNKRCLDQVALAICCSAFDTRILPPAYNYPLPLRSKMADTTMQQFQLDDMIHVHYHRWFQKENFIPLLRPQLVTCSKLEWLNKQLPISPMISDHFPH